jgi:Family of unknown function (DUF5906)
MTDDNIDFDRLAEAVAQRVEEKRKAHETKGNGADTGPDPDLLEMNQKFSIVLIGGKTRVMWREESPVQKGCSVPVYSKISDFKTFHDRRRKPVIVHEKPKQLGLGTWWINHPERAQYDGVVYVPNRSTPGKINLWEGFAVKPAKGSCGRYLDHLHQITCNGDTEHCEYLLNFMAHNVQHPDRPGGVATVLRGDEGVGKGITIHTLGALFGTHYRHVVQAAHLVGKFNAHLQHCSCLYADEAFFAGDRQHESTLKALITEPTIMIEQKGIDAYSAPNCIHLYMSSNSDWVVPAGAKARRYFVLDVSDKKRENYGYFDQIRAEMDTGGDAALLDLLLCRDISDFNIRDVPQTDALSEQKRFSRRGIDQLIEIIAHRGELPCAHPEKANVAITSGEEEGKGFYAASKKLVRDLSYSSAAVIAKTLKDNWDCGPWKDTYRRGLKFPSLIELRQKFDERHGTQVWDEPNEWQLPHPPTDWNHGGF